MNFFQSKFALITGGSSGIGFALAKAILKQGGDVAILARRLEILTDAVIELSKFKKNKTQRILAVQADVTDQKMIEEKLLHFVQTNGLPDIVINSAGVAHPGKFEELKEDIFHWMMDVNYFGTVYVLKSLIPLMQQRKSGVILNISSMAGFIGVYGYTAYGASKYAVSGLSDVLRSELKPEGIQVSIAFPPDTDTPQLAYESQYKPFVTKEIAGSAKQMSADEVADQTLAALSRKQYIILPGAESKTMYFLHHFIGKLIYPVMDLMVSSALKKQK